MRKPFTMIHDLIDPGDPDGRSYKQVNAQKIHNIHIGALVELDSGARLFVVWHGRDCDQTPLYWLCPDKDNIVKERASFSNFGWHGGYPESALKVVLERASVQTNERQTITTVTC